MNERNGVNLVTPPSWRMVWSMVSISTRGVINPPMKRKKRGQKLSQASSGL